MLGNPLVQRLHSVQIDGGSVRVHEFTPAHPPAEGTPTLVLAHGWTLSHESWERVIRRILLEHDVRVLAYDQPGHGTSSPSKSGASVKDLGRVLKRVLDVLVPEGKIVLGGHSMGGMAIMAYAGLQPVEFRERIAGVALVSTAPSVENRKGLPGEELIMSLFTKAPLGLRAIPLPSFGLARTLFGESPDHGDVKATARIINANRAHTVGTYFRALQEHDEDASLAEFEGVPTTILVGSRDGLTPARWSREYHTKIPGSTLQVIPGKGHMLLYEATREVTTAIENLLFPQPD